MSRRAPRCLALGLAALLAAAGPAAGQQTKQELIQHLDTLLPPFKGARARAADAQIARRRAKDARVRVDTVEIGPLKVLVIPGEDAAARDVVGGVWEREYAPWLDASPTLAADRIFFRWSQKQVDFSSSAFSVRVVQGDRWRSRAYMEGGVRWAIGQSLKGDLTGTRFGADWSVKEIRRPEEPGLIYRQVALQPSQAARSCLGGELEACVAAFGLEAMDVVLSRVYTPQERRLFVLSNGVRFDPEGLRACRGGDLAECDRLLRDLSAHYPARQHQLFMVPFGPEVRASLLWFALERGGQGAWGRLLARADDEPLAALEAASGMSADALMRGWHAWLLENRPVGSAGFGPQALTGLAWILLLIALAARSTRWRLG